MENIITPNYIIKLKNNKSVFRLFKKQNWQSCIEVTVELTTTPIQRIIDHDLIKIPAVHKNFGKIKSNREFKQIHIKKSKVATPPSTIFTSHLDAIRTGVAFVKKNIAFNCYNAEYLVIDLTNKDKQYITIETLNNI